MPKPTVSAYIKAYPQPTQVILKKIRSLIQATVPTAEEGIGYGIVAYKLNGKPLVYFGGWKTHIGFYATPSGNAAFKKELSKYPGAKGSVRFPLTEPIPYSLIQKIVRYRVKEVKAQTKTDR